MTGFLRVFSLIVQLFPAVVALVGQIERVFPQPGKGQQKASLLTGAVSDAVAAADKNPSEAELAGLIATRVVQFLNATGEFASTPK